MNRLGRPMLLSLSLLLFAALAPSASAAAKQSGDPSLSAKNVVALVEIDHPRGLNRFVRAVSDPRSPRYRQYASVEKLVKRYGAKPRTRRKVLRWLSARGLEGGLDATGSFLSVELPRRRAAALFGDGGATASSTGLSPRVPASLRGAVSGIDLLSTAPLVQHYVKKKKAKAKRTRPYRSILPHSGRSTGCREARTGAQIGAGGFEPFTPNQYLTAYGHAEMHRRGFKGEGQTVALVESGGTFKHSDIVTFARCFGLKPPPIRKVRVGVEGSLPTETESTLDVEMLTAGAPGLDRILVYEGAGALGDIVLTMGAALGDRGHRPDVISISLGFCEPLVATDLTLRAAIDNVLAVAAGAGISVLVSAGDEGSSGCRVETEASRTALPLLSVSLPSSSPYATAVGGTNLELSAKNRIKQELVWNDAVLVPGGGGGGNSLLSVRTPWWQLAGRGYGVGRKVPDISALADSLPGIAIYCTAAEGCLEGDEPVPGWTSVGGTSAAAPISAGVALANQLAAKHGQPPLGFLNPLLYQLGKDKKDRRGAFSDVTLGNNDIGRALPPEAGGGSLLGCCSAKPGYDWASGWGSLKVPGFSKAASRAAS